MKKLSVVLVVCFSLVVFASCKDRKQQKEEVKVESHEDNKIDQQELASKHEYQCPMDCEKGKIYEEKGTCPVCKMDLKEKPQNEETESHDEAEHKEKESEQSEGEKEHSEGESKH